MQSDHRVSAITIVRMRVGMRCQRRLLVAACLLVCFLGPGCGEDDPSVHDAGTPPNGSVAAEGRDLAQKCDSALMRGDAADVRPAGVEFRPAQRIGGRETAPLGSVLGVDYDPGAGHLYVLDGMNAAVKVYSNEGDLIRQFGSSGEGPGEFQNLGGPHFKYDQLAVVDGEHVFARSHSHVHHFTASGEFVDRHPVEQGRHSGPFSVPHVAPITNSSVLYSTTGAFDLSVSSRGERTALDLERIVLSGDGTAVEPFARLRNETVLLPDFSRYPPRSPYRGMIQRTWDAAATGLLAVASLEVPGVCFVGSSGSVFNAYRVGASRVRVDEEERTRVLAERRQKFGPRAPMTEKRWEEFYSWWPDSLPPVTDLVLGPDSTVWLERPIHGGERRIDLVHAVDGYLGTFSSPTDSMPVGFLGSCPLMTETRTSSRSDVTRGFFGLRAWCPSQSHSRD